MSAPNALITAGLTRLRRTAAKRGTNDRVALDEIIVDHENSTRFATQEELRAKGLYRCQSEDREEEKEQLGVLVAPQSAMSGNAIVEAALRLSKRLQPVNPLSRWIGTLHPDHTRRAVTPWQRVLRSFWLLS
jgi:hypothetical protein